MRHAHYDPIAFVRQSNLTTDATLRQIASDWRKGYVAKPDAIVAMREAGACEPEILETLV